jgi:ferredoxin-thioredoxin reductase catalytic subunit
VEVTSTPHVGVYVYMNVHFQRMYVMSDCVSHTLFAMSAIANGFCVLCGVRFLEGKNYNRDSVQCANVEIVPKISSCYCMLFVQPCQFKLSKLIPFLQGRKVKIINFCTTRFLTRNQNLVVHIQNRLLEF